MLELKYCHVDFRSNVKCSESNDGLVGPSQSKQAIQICRNAELLRLNFNLPPKKPSSRQNGKWTLQLNLESRRCRQTPRDENRHNRKAYNLWCT